MLGCLQESASRSTNDRNQVERLSPQVLLDLNLPPDLLLDLAIDDLRFGQAFQRDNEMRCGLGACQVDPTKLSFTEGSANGESSEGQGDGASSSKLALVRPAPRNRSSLKHQASAHPDAALSISNTLLASPATPTSSFSSASSPPSYRPNSTFFIPPAAAAV